MTVHIGNIHSSLRGAAMVAMLTGARTLSREDLERTAYQSNTL